MNCKAPFVHIRQDTDGVIAPCSTFWQDRNKTDWRLNKDQSLNDFFHSSKYDSFRDDMVNSKVISGCKDCIVDSEQKNPSHRDYWNSKYSNVNDIKVRELELCLSNKCNFACIMCNSHFSQRLYQRDLKLNQLGVDNKGQISTQRNVISSTNIDDMDLSELNTLRLLGGEPFVEKSFLKIFKTLKDKNVIQNVTLTVNTNNSIFPDDTWLSYLELFKDLKIVLSLDAVGEHGEFIRKGLKFEKFKQNKKLWSEISEVSFNSVLYNFSILGLHDLVDYVGLPVHYGVEGHDHALDLSLGPYYLSLIHLPYQTKKMIEKYLNGKYDEILDFMYSQDNDINYTNQYIIMFSYLNKSNKAPPECLKIYKSVMNAI